MEGKEKSKIENKKEEGEKKPFDKKTYRLKKYSNKYKGESEFLGYDLIFPTFIFLPLQSFKLFILKKCIYYSKSMGRTSQKSSSSKLLQRN